MTEAPVIEAHRLGRRFGERRALHDVSFRLNRGETLAVLGQNGAGKSTLLRILSTLLRPHEGDVAVLGEALPRRAFAVRAHVGLLGHEPLLYRDLTGRENLHYHARLRGISPERVDELLDKVGMQRRADDPVRSLSRGLVQRVAVCRAVLHDPRLLLLDEPRANLDPAAVELVEPLIGRGNGRARVITSHDPRAAVEEADLVMGLRDGRSVLLGAPAEVRDRLEALYA